MREILCCECHQNKFQPRFPKQIVCDKCWRGYQTVKNLLLSSYYEDMDNLKKEVYLDNPKEYATHWGERVGRETRLTRTQLYYFRKRILKARNLLHIKNIEGVRPILWKCRRDVEYQFNRGIVPLSFKEFLEHHLEIAEKGERDLKGFYEYFESIYMYFPHKE